MGKQIKAGYLLRYKRKYRFSQIGCYNPPGAEQGFI